MDWDDYRILPTRTRYKKISAQIERGEREMRVARVREYTNKRIEGF